MRPPSGSAEPGREVSRSVRQRHGHGEPRQDWSSRPRAASSEAWLSGRPFRGGFWADKYQSGSCQEDESEPHVPPFCQTGHVWALETFLSPTPMLPSSPAPLPLFPREVPEPAATTRPQVPTATVHGDTTHAGGTKGLARLFTTPSARAVQSQHEGCSGCLRTTRGHLTPLPRDTSTRVRERLRPTGRITFYCNVTVTGPAAKTPTRTPPAHLDAWSLPQAVLRKRAHSQIHRLIELDPNPSPSPSPSVTHTHTHTHLFHPFSLSLQFKV